MTADEFIILFFSELFSFSKSNNKILLNNLIKFN